jgi:hypothetical protein
MEEWNMAFLRVLEEMMTPMEVDKLKTLVGIQKKDDPTKFLNLYVALNQEEVEWENYRPQGGNVMFDTLKKVRDIVGVLKSSGIPIGGKIVTKEEVDKEFGTTDDLDVARPRFDFGVGIGDND